MDPAKKDALNKTIQNRLLDTSQISQFYPPQDESIGIPQSVGLLGSAADYAKDQYLQGQNKLDQAQQTPALESISNLRQGKSDAASDLALQNAAMMLGNEPKSKVLPMDEASRMARAKKMGFNPKQTWYHGTKADIESFDPNALGSSTNAGSAKQGFFFAQDPSTASDYARLSNNRNLLESQRGVDIGDEPLLPPDKKDLWAAEEKLANLKRNNPDQAEKSKQQWIDSIKSVEDKLSGKKTDKFQPPREFLERNLEKYKNYLEDANARTTGEGRFLHQQELEDAQANYDRIKGHLDLGDSLEGNVIPAHLKMENPYIHDFEGEDYRDTPYSEIMKKAKTKGHDSVIFKNTYDPGDPHNRVLQDIATVFEPNQIRSKFATFDPKKKKSANILSGLGAAAIGAKELSNSQDSGQ